LSNASRARMQLLSHPLQRSIQSRFQKHSTCKTNPVPNFYILNNNATFFSNIMSVTEHVSRVYFSAVAMSIIKTSNSPWIVCYKRVTSVNYDAVDTCTNTCATTHTFQLFVCYSTHNQEQRRSFWCKYWEKFTTFKTRPYFLSCL